MFGCNMILNINHTSNWEYIRKRKQEIINKNNDTENKKRKKYTYTMGQKVLVRKGTENKYEQPFAGPYTILKVNQNGTVELQMGAITDTVNIRRIEPFVDEDSFNQGGGCSMRLRASRRSTS